jgi:hypothetical protein
MLRMSDIRPEDIKAFKRHAKALATLIIRIRTYSPEANLYLDDDNLNLMKGPSHSDSGYRPLYENSVESINIPHASGGGW